MTAHKNRGNSHAIHWQNTAVFFCLILMVASVAISRGALSISIIIFTCVAIVNPFFTNGIKRFFRTPFLWIFSLLFFIPFLSGLWSDDLQKWAGVVRLKLPLLIFPLAFAGRWMLSQKQWLIIAVIFLLFVVGGCVFGLVLYVENIEQVHAGYLQAKTINTPLENDHVRFSWLVTVAIILCVFFIHLYQQRRTKLLLLFLAAFFTIYLHILSARTGILSLYIFLLFYASWGLFGMKNRKRSLTILLLIMTLPVMAYFVLPTFKARVRFMLYDLSFVQKAEYVPGTSDGARVMSIKAGWQVLQQNPLGVGAGDIMHEADSW
ncbi:MAG: hypothetical protein M3Y85_12390, partial [Bacteroidota bacterium]|nr:hypothetical protein [Bacteroidota bacterium]